tara:strand:+ start:26 stop:388 length:363 start_codon:yes stop_codon:yes gene_type:complete
MNQKKYMNNMEDWGEIPNFDGRYLISVNGEVLDTKNDRIIKPHFMGVPRKNYYQVTLYKKNLKGTEKHTKRIHSLMAITFLGHEYGDRKIVVDHIDNNHLNNKLSNLQVITNKLNCIKDR